MKEALMEEEGSGDEKQRSLRCVAEICWLGLIPSGILSHMILTL